MPFVRGRAAVAEPPQVYSDGDEDYGYRSPGTGYRTANSGVDLAIRTIAAEDRAGDQASRAAIAGVINNRSKWTGKSIGEIVQERSQFEPWMREDARTWMLSLKPDSPEYQAAAAVALPIFAGQAIDPTDGATMFYSPKTQKALGRPKPVFDDGTGIPIGDQLYFKGDYRQTHLQGRPVHIGNRYRFESGHPTSLLDPRLFSIERSMPTVRTGQWPTDGSAGVRPPLR